MRKNRKRPFMNKMDFYVIVKCVTSYSEKEKRFLCNKTKVHSPLENKLVLPKDKNEIFPLILLPHYLVLSFKLLIYFSW